MSRKSLALRLSANASMPAGRFRGPGRLLDHDVLMAAVLIAFFVYVYDDGSLFLQTIVINSITVMILAYSWNLISGYTGYFSFGQTAFFGIGGYAVAMFMVRANISYIPAILLSAVFCAIVSAPIGWVLLRLRGIYFALGTLALFSALYIIASNLGWVGSGIGMTLPLTASPNAILVVAMVAGLIAVATGFALAHSRLGLRAHALAADEDAIRTLGVRTVNVKVVMFVIAGALAGLAGGVATLNGGFLTPDTAFSATINVQSIVFTIIGGVGTVWGPVLGTAAVEAIISRFGPSAATEVEIGLGLMIVVIVTLTPGGIVGLLNRVGALRRKVMLRSRGPRRLTIEPGWLRRPEHADTSLNADSTLLSATGVTVKFSGNTAVNSVDLRVAPGEFLAIIGANGAGKTTLFNAISGYVRRSGGRLQLGGRDVTRYDATSLARSGISRTFQIPRLAESLTVWENVLLGSLMDSSLGDAKDRADLIIDAIGLREVAYQPVDKLGPGVRRRVEIARVVATRPRVILLDEALAGMSTAEVAEVRSAVSAMREWGVDAVISVEHVLSAVRDLADRMVALDFGRVVAEGSPDEVLEHEHVVNAYLGTAGEGGAETTSRRHVASTSEPPIIEVVGLTAGYGQVRVLWDIDMALAPGEFVGVLGASGAGKTTLCRALTGSCAVHSGSVSIGGEETTRQAPHLMARAGVSFVPSSRELFGELTVKDNLLLGAVSSRGETTERLLAGALDLFPEIRVLLGNRARSLSGGQQQMVAIARALMREPRVLILDEPSTGLAPIIVGRLMQALRALADRGVAVVVVEQNAVETLRAVDRAYVLQEGRFVFDGTAEQLRDDPRLAKAYLGADATAGPAPGPEPSSVHH